MLNFYWILPLIVVFLVLLLPFALILQKKIFVVQSKLKDCLARIKDLEDESLQKTQENFIDDLTKKYQNLFEGLANATKAEAMQKVQELKEEFDTAVKKSYENACDKIKFDEIEYKKTITKKRKEFNRKNSHNAIPQKVWRSIDDE